jgi:hypothetical protein
MYQYTRQRSDALEGGAFRIPLLLVEHISFRLGALRGPQRRHETHKGGYSWFFFSYFVSS